MKKRLLTAAFLASIMLTILLASQLSIVVSALSSQTVQKKKMQLVSSLVIESNPNPSEPNQAITISGKLTSGRQGLAQRNVRIDYSVDGRIWAVVGWTKTISDGRFALSWTPTRFASMYLRAYFPGDKQYSSSFSSSILQRIVSWNSGRVSRGFCIHWPDVEQYANPTYQKKFVDSGARWTRSDVQRISTTEKFQDMYRTYHSLGIKNLGIIDYCTVPQAIRVNFTLDDWRNVVKTVMNKYNGLIDAVEVWNEPDWPEYQCGYMDGSTEHYFDMLVVAYEEIKAVNPKVPVVAGAISDIREGGKGEELLKGIFKLGASNYCDIISFHYYPWYTEQTPAQVLERIYRITGKPIWITEFSAKYAEQDATNYTEQTQADWLSKFLTSVNEASLKPQVIIWYMFHAPSPTTEEQPQCILEYDYAEKPAYQIFRNFVETA